MSADQGHKNLDFSELKELNKKFDRQLADLDREQQSQENSRSQKLFSWKKILWISLAGIAGLMIPFVVLVRTSVYTYQNYQLNGWVALSFGILATIVLLLVYGLFLGYRYRKRIGLHKYLVQAVVVLVTAYSLYGIFYYSSMNTKTREIQSYYRSLHPIIRVALTTITLADSDLVVTDIRRDPDDYAQMGLPQKKQSMHYVQSDGYVHAVDLRTKGRAEWQNWLRRKAFQLVGLQCIRHVGTADHLHVYLPLNE